MIQTPQRARRELGRGAKPTLDLFLGHFSVRIFSTTGHLDFQNSSEHKEEGERLFKLHALKQNCAQHFSSVPLIPEPCPLATLRDPHHPTASLQEHF